MQVESALFFCTVYPSEMVYKKEKKCRAGLQSNGCWLDEGRDVFVIKGLGLWRQNVSPTYSTSPEKKTFLTEDFSYIEKIDFKGAIPCYWGSTLISIYKGYTLVL